MKSQLLNESQACTEKDGSASPLQNLQLFVLKRLAKLGVSLLVTFPPLSQQPLEIPRVAKVSVGRSVRASLLTLIPLIALPTAADMTWPPVPTGIGCGTISKIHRNPLSMFYTSRMCCKQCARDQHFASFNIPSLQCRRLMLHTGCICLRLLCQWPLFRPAICQHFPSCLQGIR